MNISVFGLGYVGCVSLGCLAKNGHHVIGVDLNENKVAFINNGKASIVEKEIDEIVSAAHQQKLISASTNAKESVVNTEASIICVGTPSTKDGHLYLDSIYKVGEEIGRALKDKADFHAIFIRSTVLPGTNEKITKIIEKESGKQAGIDFAVVSNPEFLREGTAVKDYYNPPFTLIGCDNEKAVSIAKNMYKDIKAPFIVSDIRVAELIKYVNNAFHALKVTFANEVGNICKKMGVDGQSLMSIFCEDTKLNISSYYMRPGFAYGGSCLPKDLKALRTIAHDLYLECPVIENISKSNDIQKNIVLDQIIEYGKKNIGFLGLSFKSGTDDLRNSPIVDVIEVLVGKGYNIRIYDSNVHFSKIMGANKDYILSKIPLISDLVSSDANKVVSHSDVLVVVNGEEEFKDILKATSTDKIIYDLVNIGVQDEILAEYSGISW